MKRLLIAVLLLNACATNADNPLKIVLQSDDPAIRVVMENPEKHQLQILYTQVEHASGDNWILRDHSYNLDSDNYFYPASTVKLPAAVIALEYLQTIEGVTPYTPYTIEGDPRQHTVADDIRQIFAVSDNEAYNRIYELLGRDHINRALRSKGIGPARISERLSTPDSGNPQRDRLLFDTDGGTTALGGGTDEPIEPLGINNIEKGIGFIRHGELINQRMDFSRKNHFPLEAQNELMKRLFFPAEFTPDERFRLSRESYELLFRHMHRVPRQSGYDECEFHDSYGKFFLFGDSKTRIPSHMKMYNKVGWAYGTLTETAYIVDEETGIEFLLSATVLVNENRIYNDDQYEFESIGVPFLAALGREIYQFEQ